jgi:hypothetical protein
MDPNSGNQRWSRWTFLIECDPGRVPTVTETIDNARRYMSRLFNTTTARVKVVYINDQRLGAKRGLSIVDGVIGLHGHFFVISAEVEGPPAFDLEYRQWVRREFEGVFVKKGFGAAAELLKMETAHLAGSAQDGKPPSQLIVLPKIASTLRLPGVEGFDPK